MRGGEGEGEKGRRGEGEKGKGRRVCEKAMCVRIINRVFDGVYYWIGRMRERTVKRV